MYLGAHADESEPLIIQRSLGIPDSKCQKIMGNRMFPERHKVEKLDSEKNVRNEYYDN